MRDGRAGRRAESVATGPPPPSPEIVTNRLADRLVLMVVAASYYTVNRASVLWAIIVRAGLAAVRVCTMCKLTSRDF